MLPAGSVSPVRHLGELSTPGGLPRVPGRAQRASRDAGADRASRLGPGVLGRGAGVVGARQSSPRPRARALAREGVVPRAARQHLRECEPPGAVLRHPAVPRPRHGPASLEAHDRSGRWHRGEVPARSRARGEDPLRRRGRRARRRSRADGFARRRRGGGRGRAGRRCAGAGRPGPEPRAGRPGRGPRRVCRLRGLARRRRPAESPRDSRARALRRSPMGDLAGDAPRRRRGPRPGSGARHVRGCDHRLPADGSLRRCSTSTTRTTTTSSFWPRAGRSAF